MSAPLVGLRGIGKSFPGVVALDGVDLELRPGRIHALVGENGAGKSTLLGVLAGLLRPDAGEVTVGGRVTHFRDARDAWKAGVVIVHQEVDLFADLSVMENVGWQQGLATFGPGLVDWREERRRTREALATVDSPLSPDTLADDLTPAQRQLVEIAGAVSRSARVLILDEPTSSLSAAEAERLFAHLRRFREQGAAIAYVSHRLKEVFALADEITVLRDGRRVWHGPREQTTPAGLIRHMVGRELTGRPSGGGRSAAEAGRVRLRCAGLTAADGSFRDITLEARGGEVLGVYGLVGAGRSEWAQAIFGLRPLASGEVAVDGEPVRPRSPGQMATHGVAYVPEDRLRQGLCRGLDVVSNAVLASLRRLAPFAFLPPGSERRRAERIRDELGVKCSSLAQTAGTLSGGNQQKVVLGRWLAREPGVLILDEPTRGVDVGAREEIYRTIRRTADEGRAVVLISSDLPEVLAQSDRIAVFRAGRIAATFAGATAEQVAEAAFPPPAPGAGGGARVSGGDRPAAPRRLLRAIRPAVEAAGLPLFVAVFFLVVNATTGGQFLKADTLAGIASVSALMLVCAAGAMLVLLCGGLDISLGSLMALSAAVAGLLWQDGKPWYVVVAAGITVGAAGGALNAALSLVGRVHPIVVTLGTMSAYRGLVHWWLSGRDVQIPSERRAWPLVELLGLPLVVWGALGLLVLLWLGLRHTVWGRELYAQGSNPHAARRVGIHRWAVWLRAFALQGALAGLAGLLYLADSGSLQVTDHEDRTLVAIAAAVVGGVAVTGGRGRAWGVAVGCVFLASLEQVCVFLGWPPQRQQLLVGAVLLAAVLLGVLGRRAEG